MESRINIKIIVSYLYTHTHIYIYIFLVFSNHTGSTLYMVLLLCLIFVSFSSYRWSPAPRRAINCFKIWIRLLQLKQRWHVMAQWLGEIPQKGCEKLGTSSKPLLDCRRRAANLAGESLAEAKKSTPEDSSNATEVAWTWHEEEHGHIYSSISRGL